LQTNNVQKLPTNARRLVKCSTNSSTATDHYSSNCQSNPINSTFNSGKFQQTLVSQNKLPTLQNLSFVLKHSRKTYPWNVLEYQNRKTLAVDHTLTKIPNPKIHWPPNYLTGMAWWS